MICEILLNNLKFRYFLNSQASTGLILPVNPDFGYLQFMISGAILLFSIGTNILGFWCILLFQNCNNIIYLYNMDVLFQLFYIQSVEST